MFKKTFKKITTRSRKWAMDILNLTQKDITMLRRLRTDEDRTKWAMRRLEVSPKDIKIVQQIKEAGGIVQFILKQTGVDSIEDIKKYRAWKMKSKLQKIMELCPNPEEIRDYFNQSYVHYRKLKKEVHNTWKFKGGDKKSGQVESYKTHLQEISLKLHVMIRDDECTQEDFFFIASKSFMAFWCWSKTQGNKLRTAGDILLGKAETAMAA